MSKTVPALDGAVEHRPVNHWERALLEFATEWAPYGGNDEEAFVRFGLSSRVFHQRLLHLLNSPAARTLTNATVAQLRKQCASRLDSSSRSTRERRPHVREQVCE
ncbi:DUF3263 domain-containing protein [Nocardia spumae]|uniref:DUF3263 domain-containing protein n=1 Tax=Nocardia spumae TaxID=2887190 RepID=UPI001D14C45C|nr:DUF3263 domain-containing protein [Nocardia spumae]